MATCAKNPAFSPALDATEFNKPQRLDGIDTNFMPVEFAR